MKNSSGDVVLESGWMKSKLEALQGLFVQRSPWLSIAMIVVTGVLSSVAALLFLVGAPEAGQEALFGQLLIISIGVPALLATPVGGLIVHLLREVDRARQLAQTQALQDSLTELPNRRRLIDLGDRQLAISRRTGRPACCALIDIDDFKRINDQHGHAVGDAVLIPVSRTIAAGLRCSDTVGRWGGEELVVLFPDTDKDAGALVSERLRAAVERVLVKVAGGRGLRCTISVGLSRASGGDSFSQWIDGVDRAMYLAKAAGKNRVQVGIEMAV